MNCTEPAEGATSPATIFSSVDLPQPEGPTMVRNSPSPMAKRRSSKTARSRPAEP
jgi:hypothetical protein